LATDKELSDFLKSVEKRAWKRAVYAVRDEDAALDIVQDAMIRLSEKYIDRPASELPLLFQRIVSNATMDWFRRQKVRNAVVRNFSEFEGAAGGDGDFDILETLESLGSSLEHESAAESVSRAQILQLIESEVALLPARQREAFSCVTGRNSMSLRQPPPWAVRGQRQDALLAGSPCLGQALRAKGIGT
jgi:RNA polymerase sigma-70 factor (ECF subfamily)